MGAESKTRKRFNNERAQLSEVKHFLCYFCGETYPTQLEYQRHITNFHQVYSIGYQLWNAKHAEKNKRKSRGADGRRSIEKAEARSVRPTPEPSHKRASPEYSQETKHSKKRRRSTSRASSPIDEYQKVSKNVEKKEKSRQPKDETAVKKKKEKKDKESSKQEYAKKVAEETKKRERRSPTPAANFDLEADALRKPSDFIKTSVRQCEECNVSCSLFHDLISHYVEKHGAKIGRVCLFLFCDTTLLARKVSPPGRNCPRCELKFESDVQYFVHLLSDHVLDICYQLKGDAFASFDNVDTEVSLKMPNKPDLAFSFNIVLPRGKQMFLPKIYNNRPSY